MHDLACMYTPSHRVCQEELLGSLIGDLLVLGHAALALHPGLGKGPESVLAGLGLVIYRLWFGLGLGQGRLELQGLGLGLEFGVRVWVRAYSNDVSQ